MAPGSAGHVRAREPYRVVSDPMEANLRGMELQDCSTIPFP